MTPICWRILNLAAIRFPVLTFSGSVVYVMATADELTACKRGALKNGWFDDMLIVDAIGVGYQVRGARKLHGVGPFYGYNIFLNQTIKVELLTGGDPLPVSLDMIKARVLKSFKDWHGWEATGEVEDLTAKATAATSIAEVQLLLSEKGGR